MRPAPGLAGLFAAAMLAGGCTTPTQQAWTPTVDTYGNSRAPYLSVDTIERSALAAGGAAIGAVLGNPGRGAALANGDSLAAELQ